MLDRFAQTFVDIFGWRVILDILVLGMALFLIYRTLRRLGTWKILTGLLIAILLFAVAKYLDLRGIIWIYSNLSQVAVIALIVIFQPELRKMFERFASLGRERTASGGQELSTLISDAMFALAQQKRGAIVVFPGKEPVAEWLAGGLTLDAEPSSSLIMSIFDPHSPGHDGAMVIENGRLSTFGVRLPLSKVRTLSEEFGTRHHAAMGLSEVSDALVVVVSEERGTVTAFYGGKMRKVPDKDALHSGITSHWHTTGSYTFFTVRPRKRWTLAWEAAVSVVLALAFWSTVILAQSQMRERVLSVPIEYIATPENIALVGEKPTEVKLHLSGPKADLDSLHLNQPTVRIDLSKAEAGKQQFVITEKDLNLPKSAKLLDADPSTLTLSFKQMLIREVPVKPQLVGRPPYGLQIGSVEVNPKTVWILTPSDYGEKQEITVITTPIYLHNMDESTSIFCKIIAPPNIQPAGKRWPDVEVVITLTSM